MLHASTSCRWLLMHCAAWAVILARLKAGSSSAARMAMMAMTASSSSKVNARRFVLASAGFITRFQHCAVLANGQIGEYPITGEVPPAIDPQADKTRGESRVVGLEDWQIVSADIELRSSGGKGERFQLARGRKFSSLENGQFLFLPGFSPDENNFGGVSVYLGHRGAIGGKHGEVTVVGILHAQHQCRQIGRAHV